MAPDEVRNVRTALGLTRRAFGAKVGVAKSTVIDWELARSPVPQRREFVIAQLLAEAMQGQLNRIRAERQRLDALLMLGKRVGTRVRGIQLGADRGFDRLADAHRFAMPLGRDSP